MPFNHNQNKYYSNLENDDSLQISLSNNLRNIQQAKSFTHNTISTEVCSTCNDKKLRGRYPFYPAPHVPAAYLKWAAYAVYRRSKRGLTFKDLVRGRYRCAITQEQAQNLLHLHKNSENLYVKSTRSRPQQYFSTKDDAEQADIQDKRNKLLEQSSTHIEVSGSKLAAAAAATAGAVGARATASEQEQEEEGTLAEIAYHREREERRATDFGSILQVAASKRRVGLLWGMHDVRMDFFLPPEVYSDDEELRKAAPVAPTQQKPRRLSIKVDRFIVVVLIYSKGHTVVTIGTREQPLPISDVPGHVSASLTALAGEIRSRLCSVLTGSGGNRIVPHVHEWRLMHLDLNTDVRVTANTYVDLAVNSVQLPLADNVLLGVYRTMTDKLDADHHRYVRVEDRNHQFKSNGRNGTPLDGTVGQVVTSAVENFRRQLEQEAAVSSE